MLPRPAFKLLSDRIDAASPEINWYYLQAA